MQLRRRVEARLEARAEVRVEARLGAQVEVLVEARLEARLTVSQQKVFSYVESFEKVTFEMLTPSDSAPSQLDKQR